LGDYTRGTSRSAGGFTLNREINTENILKNREKTNGFSMKSRKNKLFQSIRHSMERIEQDRGTPHPGDIWHESLL
jgi:hypothetical protein